MADILTLSAQARQRAGKGAARATRRAGMVPGVIYGGKKDPLLIALAPKELLRESSRAGFFTHLYDVQVDGATERVLARDLQRDPVTERPVHVDFMRVGAESKVHVQIPVQFVNQDKAPGIKRGGVLNIVRHEVELICAATAIPEHITVDLTGLDIGDSVHISAVQLPEGSQASAAAGDFTIATIVAPTVEQEAPAAAEGVAAVPVAGTPAA